MNFAMWALAGGILGWAGFAFLRFNEGRGKLVSIIIGGIGALVGGNVIAPMFTAAQAVPGAFSSSALIFAAVGGAVFVAVGNVVYNQWGV